MAIPDSYTRARPEVPEERYWIDPDPQQTGLLLSYRILYYCEELLLIFPYDEAFIEPASYTLHAGCEYIIANRPGQYETHDLER